MIYFQLFLSFFQIGLFSFGGGYAAMPLIQGQVVQGHGWLSMSEFTDLITISQMTPGPIAVNSATFVGIKIAGIPGALAATFGCILPSCILVTLLAKLYLKYREMAMLQGILHSLRPAVVAMIGSAGISILVTAFWSSEGDTVIRLAPDELESCRDLYHQPHPAAERQKGPNLCDGTGRGDEGGSGAGGKICGIRADVKN